jgi:hypothetical protein
MAPKPKQWFLADEDEKFRVWRYEAGDGSNSGLWIDLRWSINRKLFVSLRSNAIDDGARWLRFDPPQANHAVAKRRAFEMIAQASVTNV